jgi:hypothetical protein
MEHVSHPLKFFRGFPSEISPKILDEPICGLFGKSRGLVPSCWEEGGGLCEHALVYSFGTKLSCIRAVTQDPNAQYACGTCSVAGHKLWRNYVFLLEHVELVCANCLAQRVGIFPGDISAVGLHLKDGIPSDQIGRWLPAVPAPGGGFWGYTSVPSKGVKWWRDLPTWP